MTGPAWTWTAGASPVLATAIHAGHELRDAVASLTALDDAVRLREEDPYTDAWTQVAASRCVFHRSRFEVDVNRPRREAVYLQPEDCWGLQPWRVAPPANVLEGSTALYDRFYAELFEVGVTLQRRWGCFVVLDLHSYNHRRLGADASPADPALNPEINIGTATIDRDRWGGLVDGFVTDLAAGGFDVRCNVRFWGAHQAAWLHDTFPEIACCLAVDVKKIYMDEHTGELDLPMCRRISKTLAATVPGLERRLAA